MPKAWSDNCRYYVMANANMTLKLEAPWEEVKEMLKETNVELTDEDLELEEGRENELLERLSKKLHKTVPETRAYIESVSHNSGIAG